MNVAVVILNWNGKKLLQQFLPSVVAHSEKANIYVIDNHSDDDSVAYIKDTFPNIRCILLDKNYGFAEGYNRGLKDIKASYFVLLNSDVEVSPGWLQALLACMESNPGVACCQPKVLDYKKKNFFEYAGAAGGYIDAYGYPFCRGRLFTDVEEDTGQYDTPAEIFWASGAAFCVRASLFFEAGGFDTRFFAHMEEIDLCWRLKNMGYSIWCAPASVIYHLGGATLDYSSPRKTFLNFRNNLLTMLKNLPAHKLFRTLFIRMLLDGLAAIKFLVGLRPLHAWAIFTAHLRFYTLFLRYYNMRKTNIPKNISGIYQKNTVFAFFLQNKTRFSDLSDSQFS